MCSTRGWLANNIPISILREAPGVLVAASLLLVGCGLSPGFENATTNQTGADGAGSLSIPVPASANGSADLLIAILGVQTNPNTSGPDGWTSLPSFSGFNGALCPPDEKGTACQLTVSYKIAEGSETSASFSWGAARQAAGAVLRYSNVDTSGPIGAAVQQRGSSATPTAPVITTTRDGSRVLRVVVSAADDAKPFLNGSLVLDDEPPVLRLNVVSFPDATTDPTNGCGPPLSGCDATERAVGLAVSDARSGTAGGSGTESWELAAGDQWVTASIEIKPAPPE